MQADPRSLNQLAKDSGVDVATLSRFGNHIRGLSMPAADALAAVLSLDYRPATKPKPGRKPKAGKPKRKATKRTPKRKGGK